MGDIQTGLEVTKGISEFGMLAVSAGFFIVISASLMVICFRWFKSIIDKMISKYNDTLTLLLEESKSQNQKLMYISEALIPETQLRAKTLVNAFVDLNCEKTIELVSRVRRENHIIDKEATEKKVKALVQNMIQDMESKLNLFKYQGNPLGAYIPEETAKAVKQAIIDDLYKNEEASILRTRSNIVICFESIKLDIYHNQSLG